MSRTLAEALNRCFSFADARESALDPRVVERDMQRRFYDITVVISDTVITARFSNPRAASLFAYKYSDMLADPNLEALQFYIVHDADELRLWAQPDQAWVVSGACIQADVAAFFADNAIMMEYVEGHRAISLHAAVLAHKQHACAILGVSTAGKSTTAVACAAGGLRFLSDERCLLDAGRVVPFPRALTLRPTGRRRLLVDDGLTSEYLRAILRAADADEDFVIAPSRLLPVVGGGDARLRAVFVISGYSDIPHLQRVDLFELLPELMLGMTARERGLDRMARAIAEFQGLELYRLTLGSPSSSAAAIASVVRRGD